jgi:hypothetical protein
LNSAIASSLRCSFASGSAATCTATGAVSVDAVHDDDYWELWAKPSGNPAPSTLKVSTVFSRDDGAPSACNDGLDNDGDELVDFPADLGCSGVADAFEQVDFSSGGSDFIDGSTSVPNESVFVNDGPSGAAPTYLELRTGGVVDGDLRVFGAARVAILGGSLFGDLFALEQSVTEIHGSDFNLPLGELGETIGRVTGMLLDGSPFSVDFERAPSATIRLVPEPGGQLLAVVALVTLSGVARHARTHDTRSRTTPFIFHC